MSGRITIPFHEAVELLPEGDEIHTFVNPAPNVLIGADWERDRLIEAMRLSPEIDVTGEHAQKSGHGLSISYREALERCPAFARPEPHRWLTNRDQTARVCAHCGKAG